MVAGHPATCSLLRKAQTSQTLSHKNLVILMKIRIFQSLAEKVGDG
jgi:hypothetical protein